MTRIKSATEIDAIKESGAMLATILAILVDRVAPEMTTAELAGIAKTELRALGGSPTFLGYYGFPDVLCVSLNNEVVHGIPNPRRVIKDGDVISMDFGVTYKGMITDAARTVLVGQSRSKAHLGLVKTTKNSLDAGIQTIKDGVKTGTIGNAIEQVLSDSNFGIVRDFVGHGVGHQLHEEPNIPNYGQKNTGTTLRTGMTIAIEPMATLGADDVYVDTDGWTVKTIDGTFSAHFEDTVLVLDDGFDILTRK